MSQIPRREFGGTGLQVSVLGYGARDIEGAPHGKDISEDHAARMLNAALDAGMNFIDTSPDYGLSEERIGRHIAHRRDEYFIATKCGCIPDADRWRPSRLHQQVYSRIGRTAVWKIASLVRHKLQPLPPTHLYTPENIGAGVERSLRRLKTDYIDLLQFHGDPTLAQLREHGALDAALDLKREGKVRFVGVSTKLPFAIDHIESGYFDAVQLPYSALERDHEDVISLAAARGLATVVRGGAARGEPGKGRGLLWRTWRAARMDELLEGMTAMEFVVRFTISHRGLGTAIIGTISPEHLADNVDAVLKGPLPPDVYEEARGRFASAGSGPAATSQG